MDQIKYNFRFLILTSFATAMGGLLFGYDISVISGTIPFITEYFVLDEFTKGFVVSSLYIGCTIGVLLAGRFSDRYGRRKILMLSALLLMASSIASAIANNLGVFFVYRIIGGLGVGMASILSPMYIAEIAPERYRGAFVTINQLTIVIGMLMAYVVNYLLLSVGADCWRYMLGVMAIPSACFLLGMFFVPESPRWLIQNGHQAKAEAIFQQIGGEAFALQMRSAFQRTIVTTPAKQNAWSAISKVKRVVIIGSILCFLQQWSGINTIFFYAPDIFAVTGVGIDSQLGQSVFLGIINVAFTLVAMRLTDRLGRKPLLIISTAGMGAIYLCLGALFYFNQLAGIGVLILCMLAVALYAIGLAPLMWVVVSEIFPNAIRGVAMSIASSVLWISCYLLTLTFPMLMEWLGGEGTFWLYAMICCSGAFFIFKYIPETKGKTLEEIEQLVTKKHV